MAVLAGVPALNAQVEITMAFQVPARSTQDDWAEMAYDRALLILDPS